jgi:cation diffusion facilitator family transporter
VDRGRVSDRHDHQHEHEHQHGRFRWLSHSHHHGAHDAAETRSGAGLRAVLISLAILALTAVAQAALLAATGSVALLADLIHNAGDALTAIPLGIAFMLGSRRAERIAGHVVVVVIFVSACVALVETIRRFIDPSPLSHLWILALAGLIGAAGNFAAATVRLRGGREIHSAALVADGEHARIDGLVSLGVVASAILVGIGWQTADPLVGLALTLVILRITWQTWRAVRAPIHSSTLEM